MESAFELWRVHSKLGYLRNDMCLCVCVCVCVCACVRVFVCMCVSPCLFCNKDSLSHSPWVEWAHFEDGVCVCYSVLHYVTLRCSLFEESADFVFLLWGGFG